LAADQLPADKGASRVLGKFLRDVMKLNLDKHSFRLFSPDETESNRLEAVYEVSGKEWMADVEEVDVNLSVKGRVMEVLSEHLCEGWLEGYLLTGRHGLFSCYEAFVLRRLTGTGFEGWPARRRRRPVGL
jgi:xylulose-5-phosphate/fructose-6-phosphate phosphoketolase